MRLLSFHNSSMSRKFLCQVGQHIALVGRVIPTWQGDTCAETLARVYLRTSHLRDAHLREGYLRSAHLRERHLREGA